MAAVSVKRNSLHKNTVLRNRVRSITTCLFHSEKKTVYNEILVYCLKIYEFLLHVLNKNENVTNAGTGHFLKIAKINSQQETPICPYRKS